MVPPVIGAGEWEWERVSVTPMACEHTYTTYSKSDPTALSVVLARCHDTPVGGPTDASGVDLRASRVSGYERRHAIASSHDSHKNEKKNDMNLFIFLGS